MPDGKYDPNGTIGPLLFASVIPLFTNSFSSTSSLSVSCAPATQLTVFCCISTSNEVQCGTKS